MIYWYKDNICFYENETNTTDKINKLFRHRKVRSKSPIEKQTKYKYTNDTKSIEEKKKKKGTNFQNHREFDDTLNSNCFSFSFAPRNSVNNWKFSFQNGNNSIEVKKKKKIEINFIGVYEEEKKKNIIHISFG